MEYHRVLHSHLHQRALRARQNTPSFMPESTVLPGAAGSDMGEACLLSCALRIQLERRRACNHLSVEYISCSNRLHQASCLNLLCFLVPQVPTWESIVEQAGSDVLEGYQLRPGKSPGSSPHPALPTERHVTTESPVVLYRDTNAWCPFCERVRLAFGLLFSALC